MPLCKHPGYKIVGRDVGGVSVGELRCTECGALSASDDWRRNAYPKAECEKMEAALEKEARQAS